MNDIFISLKEGSNLPEFILVDTDFLSALYSEKELVRNLLEKFTNKTFLIDTLSRFEFLRDNFFDEVIKPKKEFLKNLCVSTEDHPEITRGIDEYAMNLSKNYAHKGLAGQASFVDLHLAGRCMKYSSSIALITGNSKHYPRFVFDRIGVINYQGERIKDQQMRVYSILTPNIENYNESLSKIPK